MVQLISDKLVNLVETHADVIVRRWTNKLLADSTTSSFSKRNLEYVEKKANGVLKHLREWISYETTKDEIGKRYAEEGMDLFKMGIPLCEAHRAMIVLRRTLWLFVVNESMFDSAFELHQMRELNDRVVLFFDRAEYYLLRGYTEAMNERIKELWNINDRDTEKIFFQKSFYEKH